MKNLILAFVFFFAMNAQAQTYDCTAWSVSGAGAHGIGQVQLDSTKPDVKQSIEINPEKDLAQCLITHQGSAPTAPMDVVCAFLKAGNTIVVNHRIGPGQVPVFQRSLADDDRISAVPAAIASLGSELALTLPSADGSMLYMVMCVPQP